MADLIPFRVHFEDEAAPPYDVDAPDARTARDRAQEARAGERVRKVKVLRDKAAIQPATTS